ncbi:hydrogenase maturation protease [Anabaena cylindrica FACHB-243]|uniref:Hydrogenase maturation protease n=1 Tax=Anabaena cylindrica (strain ATCC 27899 / PCC 7122) TaxID=272123 RepID=K9ZEU8_ANACC|nr:MULTISPECIES: hydrogenase maturation protease [Anabaena]AFZ57696.1 hydrogenase maturation protease [Anabaena cylindrica PCC 7122]MBD2419391.1 hydrogenase maturation protease [Anabaena cylindrica FACHB-243]MBY5280605.1 hydrogenase maturation protease [Anabaena sp. CCAP 1446/1C]MBY5307855.1 hydrogenase maturation protease [Anabaena sp. CCAP 1446/1C]MCM2407573.1 hydrogenase maturation protease [Anabaena sp. CCAP 1446/1C]
MLTIIGCGNLNRNDDAVGVIIAQRLQQYLAQNPHPNIRVFDCGTAGMEVMFQARGSEKLIILDASCTGSEPGAIFKVPGKELEALPEPSYNLHDFRWDHALAAGRKIFADDFPQQVTVYLIEAANLDLGLELSPVVQHSADLVFAELITIFSQNVMA